MLHSTAKKKKKAKKSNKNLAFIEHKLSARFFPFFISLNPHYTNKSRHFSDFTYRVLVIYCLFNPMRGGRQGFESSSNKPHFKTWCLKQKYQTDKIHEQKLKRWAVTMVTWREHVYVYVCTHVCAHVTVCEISWFSNEGRFTSFQLLLSTVLTQMMLILIIT